MAFTNSFHSSARGHSIKNATKLSSCQRHNSRGYQAWDYSADKISALIGQPDSIANDVRAFIDDTFAEARDRYNEKQKRADRKISVSPFEHFCDNKKMDIATESILQIADKEFWDDWRTDEYITRNGKNYIQHSFSPEVQNVMDSIFTRQLEAYEHIYETHGDEILNKIKSEQTLCKNFISKLGGEKLGQFEKLRTAKTRDRDAAIKAMSTEEQNTYTRYTETVDTLNSIDEIRLIERIEAGQMHIKVINATGHYDEYSPHAHAISVCWADGFRQGLESRIAKSVVLNRWSLEVIQDRLHEIAQEEIDKHPYIFRGRQLDKKQQGRNSDYSKEYYLRRKLDTLQSSAFVIAAQIENQKRTIESQFTDIIDEAIDNVAGNNAGIYDNVMFLLSECSDERFEELDREGEELKKRLLPRAVDVNAKKDGLMNVIRNVETHKPTLSWAERQKLWEQYSDVSRQFWDLRAELMEQYGTLVAEEYDNKRYAMQSYYNATHTINCTRSLIVALGCIVWTLVSFAKEVAIDRKIAELKAERQKLIRNTASFKRYSNAYREDLKAGRFPAIDYLDAMENVVKTMDAEAAAQLSRKYDKYLEKRYDRFDC